MNVSMRQWIGWIALLVLALQPTVGFAQDAPPVQQLLHEAIAAQGQESLVGTEVVEVATPLGVQRQVREVWRHQGMERVVVKEASLRTLLGRVEADNGVQTIQYYPPPYNAMFVRASLTPEQRRARKQKMLRQLAEYNLGLVGPDTVAGRAAWVVDLLPRQRGKTIRRVWLDQQTAVQLRTEERDSQGRLMHTSYFERVQFNPRPAPTRADFTFTPPQGARIVDEFPTVADAQRRVRFHILEPTYTPQGFFLEGVGVVRGPRQRVMLRYNGEPGVCLLNEGLLREDGPGAARVPTTPTAQGDGVFVWHVGDVILVLIGPRIPQSELERMAKSIR
jgi:negative regulator of sigma E activity